MEGNVEQLRKASYLCMRINGIKPRFQSRQELDVGLLGFGQLGFGAFGGDRGCVADLLDESGILVGGTENPCRLKQHQQ